MYIIVGHHGHDDQRIKVWVTNMMCVIFAEGDSVRLSFDLLGRSLIMRARNRDQPFPGLSEVAILGSSRFPGEVWSTEDSFDLARRSCLLLVLAGLGAPVADVVMEVPFLDAFFDLILERDAYFSGVVNVSVILAVLVLVSFGAVSPIVSGRL